MDWSYIAGLFDGEGSITMYRGKSRGNNLVLQVHISSTNDELNKKIKAFFEDSGLTCHMYKTKKNHWGFSAGVIISAWPSVELFVKHVSPLTESKTAHLEIAQKIVNLYKLAKTEGGPNWMRNHLPEFDSLRRELHALAIKGRKVLTVWS